MYLVVKEWACWRRECWWSLFSSASTMKTNQKKFKVNAC